MVRSRAVRLAAVVCAVGLVTAACGGDRADDTAGTTAPPATTAGGSGATTTAPTTEPEGVKFGTLDSPCGPGDAKGATDQGVTDTEITIGYGDDRGYPQAPGLNKEMSDAVEAFMKWCNDQGGINGRKVVGKLYDAKILEVNNVMTEACKEVFMLVGEGWALDGLAEQTRVQCNLPAVPTYSVNPAFAHGPNVFPPIPNAVDLMNISHGAQLAKLYPDKIKKAAVMYGNFASTIESKEKILNTLPSIGYEFLPCEQVYNIQGEADWKPFAQKLKDCGAEIVYYSGSPFPNFQNMLTASAQIGFNPIWFSEGNFYMDLFAQWNKDGLGDNTYVRTAIAPFEQADLNPATKQYIDIVTGNGGKIAGLGAQAASAFLLWATAAKSCGSDLTRACMIDYLSKVQEWDGGGLHVKASPGSNNPGQCGMLLKLQGQAFVQAAPATKGQFECDPGFLKPVTAQIVADAKLDANRRSTLFTGGG